MTLKVTNVSYAAQTTAPTIDRFVPKATFSLGVLEGYSPNEALRHGELHGVPRIARSLSQPLMTGFERFVSYYDKRIVNAVKQLSDAVQ